MKVSEYSGFKEGGFRTSITQTDRRKQKFLSMIFIHVFLRPFHSVVHTKASVLSDKGSVLFGKNIFYKYIFTASSKHIYS